MPKTTSLYKYALQCNETVRENNFVKNLIQVIEYKVKQVNAIHIEIAYNTQLHKLYCALYKISYTNT